MWEVKQNPRLSKVSNAFTEYVLLLFLDTNMNLM